MDKYLDAKEGAEYILHFLKIKVSPNFLRLGARKGNIAHTKIGARIFFTKDDLESIVTHNDCQPNNRHESIE